jgi:hypothetical protein
MVAGIRLFKGHVMLVISSQVTGLSHTMELKAFKKLQAIKQLKGMLHHLFMHYQFIF